MLLFGSSNAEMLSRKKCVECGGPYIDHTFNRRMKYCGRVCQGRRQRRVYNRKHRSMPIRELACKECQLPIKTPYRRKMFCSVVCCQKWWHDKNRMARTVRCAECLVKFKQRRSNMRFCSRKCGIKPIRKKWYDVWNGGKIVRNLKCPFCGDIFLAKGLKVVYCSRAHKASFWSRVADGYASAVPNFKQREAA